VLHVWKAANLSVFEPANLSGRFSADSKDYAICKIEIPLDQLSTVVQRNGTIFIIEGNPIVVGEQERST